MIGISRPRILIPAALSIAALVTFSLLTPALAIEGSPATPPKPQSFDVHNPKLNPVNIKAETVSPLSPHPEWHLLKTSSGFKIYAKPDPTGRTTGGDTSACGVVTTLAAALGQLGNRLSSLGASAGLGGATGAANADPVKLSTTQQNGYCTADLTRSIPPAVRDLLNQHPFYDGPSSWTAVLFTQKMINTQRVVDDSEFTQLMDSPVCHTLSKNDSPKPGDIGVVHFHLDDGRFREQSAFLQVSDDMLFTRDDSSRSTPYSLQSLNTYLTSQNLSKMPARCRDLDATNNSGCPTELVYKRCTSLQQYRASHSLDPKLAPLAKALDQAMIVEKKIEPVTLGRIAMSEAIFEEVLDGNNASFDSLNTATLELMKKVDPADAAWLYAGQTRSILIGNATQISGITMQNSNEIQSETKLYAHEPWQGVVLGTQVPVGPNGPVTRYLTCAPFQKDPGCPNK